MSHNKIRAAARRRMVETGEPYAVARRAVIAEYVAAQREVQLPDSADVEVVNVEVGSFAAFQHIAAQLAGIGTFQQAAAQVAQLARSSDMFKAQQQIAAQVARMSAFRSS